jgi:hypothetical protein
VYHSKNIKNLKLCEFYDLPSPAIAHILYRAVFKYVNKNVKKENGSELDKQQRL